MLNLGYNKCITVYNKSISKEHICNPLYHYAGSKRSPVKRVLLCFIRTDEIKKARGACSFLFHPGAKYGVFKVNNKGVGGNQAQNEGWKDKGKSSDTLYLQLHSLSRYCYLLNLSIDCTQLFFPLFNLFSQFLFIF